MKYPMKGAYVTQKTKEHLLRMAERIEIILKSKIIITGDVDSLRKELREIRQLKGGWDSKDR